MPEKITTNATEEGKVICNCKNVTLGEIHAAIAQGACTIEDIEEKTNAGTGCKKCKGLIEEILNKSK